MGPSPSVGRLDSGIKGREHPGVLPVKFARYWRYSVHRKRVLGR